MLMMGTLLNTAGNYLGPFSRQSKGPLAVWPATSSKSTLPLHELEKSLKEHVLAVLLASALKWSYIGSVCSTPSLTVNCFKLTRASP